MSRLTFRNEAGAVAWQKQLRDHYEAEGVPPVPHLSVKRAMVRPVSRRLAEQIILKYEWLGTMANTSAHYGIFFGDYCAGVACVALNGVGAAGAYHFEQFGIRRHELATLARGACVHWAPSGANSKLVSLACRILANEGKAKLIMAYSDSEAGEIGTIYQACNWAFIGYADGVRRKDMELIAPNGRIYNRRVLGTWAQKNGTTTKAIKFYLLANGWKMQPGNPKGRYVYVLDKSDARLVKAVRMMSRPYPKREHANEAT